MLGILEVRAENDGGTCFSKAGIHDIQMTVAMRPVRCSRRCE